MQGERFNIIIPFKGPLRSHRDALVANCQIEQRNYEHFEHIELIVDYSREGKGRESD